MSAAVPSRSRRRRRRPLRRAAPWALRLLLAAALVAAGVAVGQALERGPTPGGSETRVRTLKPLPLPPARETVTVTVAR